MYYDFFSDKRFKDIKPIEGKCLLSSPTMHGDEERYVHEAFESGWITTVGKNIDRLEETVAELAGVKYAVGLSCGTAALHLATKLAGERLYGQARPNHGTLEGKRVFCSDVTFDASINPVAYEDGEAVFIDTEYDTWNMDPEALRAAFDIYPDVKLIVVAHLYGTPAKMEEIRAIADDHNALVIEDAAESLGAKYFIAQSSPLFKEYCKKLKTSVDIHRGDGNLDISGKVEKSETLKTNSVRERGIWVETGALGDCSAISFNGNNVVTTETCLIHRGVTADLRHGCNEIAA